MRDKYKTIEIDGRVYQAEKVTYANPIKEKPARAPREHILPKHTSLFVKTLEEECVTPIVNVLVMRLLTEGKFQEAHELKSRGKILWMKSISENFDNLTKYLIGRLDS
jgi:hypothetical protein